MNGPLSADPPPLVSFTFGCPPAGLIAALSDAGCLVAVTVTGPREAAIAAAAGADALCVQGVAAADRGDTERMSLWAGLGYRSARDRPASEIIKSLCPLLHLTRSRGCTAGITGASGRLTVFLPQTFEPARRWVR